MTSRSVVDVQLPRDAVDGPRELHTAGVGRASHLGGDLSPGIPLGAQVDQAPFVAAEAVSNRTQELRRRDNRAGAWFRGGQGAQHVTASIEPPAVSTLTELAPRRRGDLVLRNL